MNIHEQLINEGINRIKRVEINYSKSNTYLQYVYLVE